MASLGRAFLSQSGATVFKAADHFTLSRCKILRELNLIASILDPSTCQDRP
jgi:hypothetical protein